jgi:hypothetical protein
VLKSIDNRSDGKSLDLSKLFDDNDDELLSKTPLHKITNAEEFMTALDLCEDTDNDMSSTN